MTFYGTSPKLIKTEFTLEMETPDGLPFIDVFYHIIRMAQFNDTYATRKHRQNNMYTTKVLS